MATKLPTNLPISQVIWSIGGSRVVSIMCGFSCCISYLSDASRVLPAVQEVSQSPGFVDNNLDAVKLIRVHTHVFHFITAPGLNKQDKISTDPLIWFFDLPAQLRSEGRRWPGGRKLLVRDFRALHGLCHRPHQGGRAHHPRPQEEAEDEVQEGGQDPAQADHFGRQQVQGEEVKRFSQNFLVIFCSPSWSL